MRIRAGFELAYHCPAPTPMVLTLDVHPSRHIDLLTRQDLSFSPDVPARRYRDGFGNMCTRVTMPSGLTTVRTDFEIFDEGGPDPVVPDAAQLEVSDLPDEVLVYLLGSRYCETDVLSDLAWSRFGGVGSGWSRVQAICDFVHDHITFNYQNAHSHRTAHGAYLDRTGVCRDFAHLAIALCRCVNIPARYCTGYLGDIGVPPVPDPMDFSAWFQAYLGGRWCTFDARHNIPRIGRVLIATGRDATDVAISTSYGPSSLVGFQVVTEEVWEERPVTARSASSRDRAEL